MLYASPYDELIRLYEQEAEAYPSQEEDLNNRKVQEEHSDVGEEE